MERVAETTEDEASTDLSTLDDREYPLLGPPLASRPRLSLATATLRGGPSGLCDADRRLPVEDARLRTTGDWLRLRARPPLPSRRCCCMRRARAACSFSSRAST